MPRMPLMPHCAVSRAKAIHGREHCFHSMHGGSPEFFRPGLSFRERIRISRAQYEAYQAYVKSSRPLLTHKLSTFPVYQTPDKPSDSFSHRFLGTQPAHSKHRSPYKRHSPALRLSYEVNCVIRAKPKFTAESTSSVPKFITSRPNTANTILSSLPKRRHSSSYPFQLSIPPVSQLVRAFHSLLPRTGSYVDFSLTPRITIPKETQLTEEIVDQLTNDLDRFADELKKLSSDLRNISRLGQLPVSVENNQALRVYFANCEPDRLTNLLEGAEVTLGIVRSQNESSCSSDPFFSDTTSMSSWSILDDTPDTSIASAPDLQEFYSVSETNSQFELNVANFRGMIPSIERSASSITTPSLTSASSNETISEGSSMLYL